MTRAELMQRMSAAEFIEWRLLEQIEPFGDRRSDVQVGLLCALIANIHRGKDTRPYTITDFVPTWDPPAPVRPQTPEEQLQFMLMIQATQNAKANA